MPVSAASFGQVAVLLQVVTKEEHRDLSKELHAALKAGRPTSYAKLLLRRGVSTSTVKTVLRKGSSLESVRCDACGTSIPQAKLPRRTEYPCPRCGSLLLGFAAYARREPARAEAAAPVVEDGEAQTLNFRQALPLPAPPPSAGLELATPALEPEEGLGTALFREVFVLPADRGDPRSDDETTNAFGELAESGGDTTEGLAAIRPALPQPAPLAGTPPAPGDPAKVGPFRVLRGLGQGSMGRVYLAEREGTGERVALKLLKPQFAADREYLERFHREARAAAGARHPHVVAVSASGNDEALGLHWIAFEYVEGGSLEDLLKRRGGMLEEEEALKVALGIARALEFTASRGIVHRDVKPANVLLARDGQPKLADLGMARHLDLSTRVTAPGIVLGTPAYLAPEQAMGVEDIDGRADLYALGVCLWEMLTGRLPLDEGVTTEQLIVRHVDEDIPDVRLYKPMVSDPTAQVVAGLCARNRDVRYPEAKAAAADIERVLAGKTPLGAKGRLALQKRKEAAPPAPKVQLRPPGAPAPPPPVPLAVTLEAAPPAVPAQAKGGHSCALLLLLLSVGLLVLGSAGAAGWWFWLRHRL